MMFTISLHDTDMLWLFLCHSMSYLIRIAPTDTCSSMPIYFSFALFLFYDTNTAFLLESMLNPNVILG